MWPLFEQRPGIIKSRSVDGQVKLRSAKAKHRHRGATRNAPERLVRSEVPLHPDEPIETGIDQLFLVNIGALNCLFGRHPYASNLPAEILGSFHRASRAADQGLEYSARTALVTGLSETLFSPGHSPLVRWSTLVRFGPPSYSRIPISYKSGAWWRKLANWPADLSSVVFPAPRKSHDGPLKTSPRSEPPEEGRSAHADRDAKMPVAVGP